MRSSLIGLWIATSSTCSGHVALNSNDGVRKDILPSLAAQRTLTTLSHALLTLSDLPNQSSCRSIQSIYVELFFIIIRRRHGLAIGFVESPPSMQRNLRNLSGVSFLSCIFLAVIASSPVIIPYSVLIAISIVSHHNPPVICICSPNTPILYMSGKGKFAL